MATQTFFSKQTKLNADSIEFCPQFDPSLFACGTYQLIEQKEGEQTSQKKVGCLYLFQLFESDNNLEFRELQAIDTSAILDLKWSGPINSQPEILGQVSSNGTLIVYSLQQTDNNTKLEQKEQYEFENTPIALSLDWNNHVHSRETLQIATSLGDSTVCIFQLDSSSIRLLSQWKTNEQYETWITAFDNHNPNLVYSGGDDGLFRGWDIRQDSPSMLFSKRYDCGVTSIQSCPFAENLLAVGSYDDTLKLWDTRNMKRPLCELNTGGGVWRIKWHPTRSDLILTACMRSGFKLVRTNLQSELQTIDEFRPDCQPIAYGADWCYWKNDKYPYATATCSFYDQHCSLWIPSNTT
mmetsp:Transcript_12189/g.16844  ORF Transcript_12189/g.16844 Transcript_12189/m.16844 type:complete len:352 (+) Transcript_12189:123-1178(+)